MCARSMRPSIFAQPGTAHNMVGLWSVNWRGVVINHCVLTYVHDWQWCCYICRGGRVQLKRIIYSATSKSHFSPKYQHLHWVPKYQIQGQNPMNMHQLSASFICLRTATEILCRFTVSVLMLMCVPFLYLLITCTYTVLFCYIPFVAAMWVQAKVIWQLLTDSCNKDSSFLVPPGQEHAETEEIMGCLFVLLSRSEFIESGESFWFTYMLLYTDSGICYFQIGKDTVHTI